MLRIEWTTPAADEFERCQTFYASLNPRAARRLSQRVHSILRQLRDAPASGRPGLRSGTRECVVTRTPYIIVYRVRGDVVELLHVFHERQSWMSAD